MSCMTIFYTDGLGSKRILIFLHVLMMRSPLPAAQLPFCVPFFTKDVCVVVCIEQHSHMWTWGPNHGPNPLLLSFSGYFLCSKRSSQWHASACFRTEEHRHLEKPFIERRKASSWFHTILVQTEMTLQIHTRGELGPAARCTWAVDDSPAWPQCFSNIQRNFCCR